MECNYTTRSYFNGDLSNQQEIDEYLHHHINCEMYFLIYSLILDKSHFLVKGWINYD